MPINKIEIRSEEINEILGKTPNKIIRWGITVILIIILVLLTGSWFFKYPDLIKTTIEVTTVNPPAEIISHSNGKIEHLFIKDKDFVEKGQYLAIIENPANYEQVLVLKKQLETLKLFDNKTDSILLFDFSEHLSLGELQSFYSVFQKRYYEYLNFFKLDYYSKKINALRDQVIKYELYYNYAYTQRNTLEKDLKLTKKDYQRYISLYDSNAIAEVELEKSQSAFLQKKYSFEGARTNLANTRISISQLEQNILELQLQYEQQKQQLFIFLNEAYENLVSQIDIWEQKYVIKASFSGTSTFTKYWSINQNVSIGEKVMTVIPIDAGKIIGKLQLPLQGSGKVKSGQKVNIKFLNYPYMEYGMVQGEIKKISLVPSENFYSVEVIFPEGLKTNYEKTIQFNQNMQGVAEIITENVRLFERIMKPIRSLIKNRSFKKLETNTQK